ncbi:hypothetical protein CC86DRAFT_401474 [Ophiobolus disseminans]|uniref:Uncharacterized protein n=1 Tax=Ophiobolus disseminans TaxID=1469910 RepID=A0A6A7AHN2_9PLEO|nr:hypothetical protein CC86DRAFT_401474 [Ophiobolus disseminans]
MRELQNANNTCDNTLETVPCAALTRVCCQIRNEYLEIQRREARLTVDLFKLPAFLRTFYSVADLTVPAPNGLHVFLHPISDYSTKKTQPVDLLPLIALRMNSLNMKVCFDMPMGENGLDYCLLVQQCQDLEQLVGHQHVAWLEVIRTGKLERIKVHRQGKYYPRILMAFVKGQEAADLRQDLDIRARASLSSNIMRTFGFFGGRFLKGCFLEILLGIDGKAFGRTRSNIFGW